MQKNSQDFSMDEIMRMANSPAGQQLIALLKQSDTGKLEQAVNQAKTGNYSQASKTLSAMLSSPEAQKLMKELGGK